MNKNNPFYQLKRVYRHIIYMKVKIFKDIELRKQLNDIKRRIRSCPKDTFMLVFTPEHGNLGDHAIAISEVNLLNNIKKNFFEVTGRQLSLLANYNSLNIFNGRPILINGGGNIGTLWDDVQIIMKQIVLDNPDSSILIFPNTSYFDYSMNGIKEYYEVKNIYSSHKHLMVLARESSTYSMLKEMGINTELMPDMVFHLGPYKTAKKRHNCIVCLRKDVEKTLCDIEYRYLLEVLQQRFNNNVIFSDTVLEKMINVNERALEFEKKIQEFCKADLVVTDRLHGMIFSAITETPCIVINSKSPKVKGSYDWIKDLQYIKFTDDVKEIPYLIKEILNSDNKYHLPNLDNYYIRLKYLVTSIIE